ncbi:MAG: succinyl-diaminopimelate desuccinylase, partial [Vicinamibacterales bacterium]
EPTSVDRMGDMLKNGRRGSLSGSLLVKGVQGHVAYPERGRNPIHLALPALAELCSTVWDAGDRYFGPTSFQISNVHGGTGALNVIPGSFSVQFNLRFSPASPADALRQRIEAVLHRHGVEFEIEWQVSAEPFLTPVGRLVEVVTASVETVTGIRPALSTSGGTSDGRFLATLAEEVVEFGPVNATIHKVDEHVAAADLGPLSTIYETALRRLLHGTPVEQS